MGKALVVFGAVVVFALGAFGVYKGLVADSVSATVSTPAASVPAN